MTKKAVKKIKFLIFFVAISLFITAFDVRLKTATYTIDSEKITNNVRIALITDLHSCYYGKGQKNLIHAIEIQNPDIILFGGDIFDDRIPHDNTKILLKTVAKKYPCYYVTGNHEYWTGEIDYILELISSYNVEILQGCSHTVEINGEKINICGIDDPDAELFNKTDFGIIEQLQAIESASNNGFYSILLSHRPELINKYLKFNFDLILTGHAHGGQWRIPGILNGVLAPNQGWFPAYAGGEYSFEEKHMIVSRGLARESTRIPRVFNRPELVIVNLK